MNFIYLILMGLGVWMILDPWVALFFDLTLRYIYVQIRMIPMRIRLEWSLFWIRHSQRKYLRMAEQIRKDLEQ